MDVDVLNIAIVAILFSTFTWLTHRILNMIGDRSNCEYKRRRKRNGKKA